MSDIEPTHNVVSAGTGETTFEPVPHVLEGKPAPTTATLTKVDTPEDYGDVVGVQAEFEQWQGEVELIARFRQGSDEIGRGGWHWSGHESPKTIWIEPQGDNLSVELCLYPEGTKLAELAL